MWIPGREGLYKAKKNTIRKKQKRQKNCPDSEEPSKLSMLPEEMIMNCLAMVSRQDYGSLSLVSKRHRSLVLSPELYKARSLIGCTETSIYLCLSIPSDPFLRWFALYPNADLRLVPIRPHLYQPPEGSSMVAHGFGIYVIGGMIGGKRSSRVFFLDCRFHTWTNLPSMGLARASAAAGVVDGKIYVFGGCQEPNSHRWVEVFNPNTQTWEGAALSNSNKSIFALNEKGDGFFYTPSQGIWKTGTYGGGLSKGWHVIDNVIYSCATGGSILWCEASELESNMEWRQVMGLEDLRDTLSASKLVYYGPSSDDKHLDDMLPGHKLSNSGPNMLLFWDVRARLQWQIWCAEISLQRRKETNQIWATVQWSRAITAIDRPLPLYSHPDHCKILYSLSLNL